MSPENKNNGINGKIKICILSQISQIPSLRNSETDNSRINKNKKINDRQKWAILVQSKNKFKPDNIFLLTQTLLFYYLLPIILFMHILFKFKNYTNLILGKT
jgi:hypothetical protein